jgi:hydrogenase nickel incorporation protein HypA/HybF
MKHALKSKVNRVLSINLEIGALSDLESEWIQRYFDQLSRGTVVEGAKLKINRVPAQFNCNQCQQSFEIYSLLAEDLSCKECLSKEISLVSGREYHVINMEAL